MAKKRIPPEEISDLFHHWLRQDKARPLLLSAQKKGISLVEITDELNRFFNKEDVEEILAMEDRTSIRTALIRRFFTDRLEYANVAKNFITLEDFVKLLDHVIGPAQGCGKLGGKTSGVFLAEKIIQEEMEHDELLKDISFPKSWYVTSDTILNFVHYNDLDEAFHVKYLNPDQIRKDQPFLEQVFKNASFPHEIMEGLRKIIRDLEGKPIIIRSSSLLEDSFGAFLAYIVGMGNIFTTLFGINEIVGAILFWILASSVIYLGLEASGKTELIMGFVLIVIFIGVTIMLFPHARVENALYVDIGGIFSMVGVVIFAFGFHTVIPDVYRGIGSYKKTKKILVLAFLIPTVIYGVFMVMFLMVFGKDTPQVAT